MIVLYALLITAVLTTAFVTLVGWTVHRSQVDAFTKTWDYATFEQFKKQFNKCPWKEGSRGWNGSLFDYDSDSQIHADILQFDGKGMKLSYFGWIAFLFFMRKNYKNIPNATKRVKGIWENTKPGLTSVKEIK